MIMEKVQTYCAENHISVAKFERMCGIGNGTVSKWSSRKSKPSLNTLEKMSKATKKPLSYWMGVF